MLHIALCGCELAKAVVEGAVSDQVAGFSRDITLLLASPAQTLSSVQQTGFLLFRGSYVMPRANKLYRHMSLVLRLSMSLVCHHIILEIGSFESVVVNGRDM